MLGLGGSLFTWMLFRFRLVPRFISVVGLIGYALVFVASIAGWFGLVDITPGGNGSPVAVPVALFEIILLPFWLLFKGFKTPEATETIQCIVVRCLERRAKTLFQGGRSWLL
jgi:hypothetical protein